ncbi:MAG: hypothetical protein R2754_14085 [Microthrixaceae bacterium]
MARERWVAASGGAELDLLIIRANERIGFEAKRTAAPRTSKSLRSAVDTLGLDRTDLIHGGEHSFPLGEDVEAVSVKELATHTQW